jgi:peptide/nickel transport system ATP-binding protein
VPPSAWPPSAEHRSAGEAGLDVRDLRVTSVLHAVDIVSDVSFRVPAGSTLGIVGESGCGKTTVAMALLGYARPGTRIAGGSVQAGGSDLLQLDESELRRQRGRTISFVPQNPAKSLSPGMRIGRQLEEILAAKGFADTGHWTRLAFEAAQLPGDDAFLQRYPHQLSGGQQQRVAIAIALVCRPSVIVMDEPTTGLDVITQARLLQVIRDLRSERDATIVYVSHDLGVIRNLVDRVAVMYGGYLVEEGPVEDIFREPHHPYTRRLLEAIPRLRATAVRPRGIPGSAVEPWNRPAGCPFVARCDSATEACASVLPSLETKRGRTVRCLRWDELGTTGYQGPSPTPAAMPSRTPAARTGEALLKVRDLVAGYGRAASFWRRQAVLDTVAVNAVSLDIPSGRCVAVVGESGSGKTTLARCVAGLHAPASGEIIFAGQRLAGTPRHRAPDLRRRIQIVFQDPDSSLNPSMSVGHIVARPLRQFFRLDRAAERRRVEELLQLVRLPASSAARTPEALSGGEKQRVALARALAAEPDLLICDEVTSALDVAVQASILQLLEELRVRLSMSLLFISHDLAVVRTISESVIVMQAGRICEAAPTAQLFAAPSHPYTRELLAAVPDLRPDDYPADTAVAAAPGAAAREGGR